MAENAGVNARIVYWGVPAAGVSTTLRKISAKLRPDHRGELQEVPTRLDPTVSYEVLPIKLGQVGGVDTRIEIVAVPGAPEHAPTRKQLLDRADGVVFVVDARRERIEESVARFEELRRALSDYGRAIGGLPLVIQINKRDLADAAGLEELVRKLDVPRQDCFDTVATDGTGVLQVLSTISKSVVRSLREPAARGRAPAAVTRSAAAPSAPLRPEPTKAAPATAAEWPAPVRAKRTSEPTPPSPGALTAAAAFPPAPTSAAAPAAFEEITGRVDLEPAPDARAQVAPPMAPPGPSAPSLRVASVGLARCDDGKTVVLPVALEDENGRRVALHLTFTLGLEPTGQR